LKLLTVLCDAFHTTLLMKIATVNSSRKIDV